jgi:hypothetical protein
MTIINYNYRLPDYSHITKRYTRTTELKTCSLPVDPLGTANTITTTGAEVPSVVSSSSESEG